MAMSPFSRSLILRYPTMGAANTRFARNVPLE